MKRKDLIVPNVMLPFLKKATGIYTLKQFMNPSVKKVTNRESLHHWIGTSTLKHETNKETK